LTPIVAAAAEADFRKSRLDVATQCPRARKQKETVREYMTEKKWMQ
jgi:hypothetical protein